MSFVRFLATESKYLYNTDLKSVLTWVYDLFKKVEEENKRPRDPRPLLKTHTSLSSHGYNYNQLEVAVLSKDRWVVTSPTNCRDYLNEAIRWCVCKGKGVTSHHTSPEFHGKIDPDMLRLALFIDLNPYGQVDILEGLKNGCRVANMYGRVAGWRPIRVCRALTLRYGKPKQCYILTGDKNWQRTPQYISMLILLIRICLTTEVPRWINDAYALTGWWYEYIYHTAGRTNSSDVTAYLANSYNHMLLMVAHDRDIFDYDMKVGYSAKGDGFHGTSGLNSFIRNESFHPTAAVKLINYYKEETKKHGRGN